MKLSSVLQYKKMLQEYAVKPTKDSAYNELFKILHFVKTSPLQFTNHSELLENKFEIVNDSIEEFQKTLDSMENQIEHLIDSLEPAYFQESYRLYDQEMVHETDEYILDRKLKDMTEDIYKFITSRVEFYNSFKYPGLIIRPGRERFIKSMVACDPLYVADQSHGLIEPCLDEFKDNYVKRVRKIVLNERSDSLILKDLPDNQFGFVLAYNIFNYRPFEIIERYLREIYQKLRPGGVLGMTFNNCDLPNGVMLTEICFMCYTPGRMLLRLAESIGYEIHFRYDTHIPNTWVELKKPGTIESLRGGQSLAQILPINKKETK